MISVVGMGSISALGNTLEEVYNSYKNGNTLFTKNGNDDYLCKLSNSEENIVNELLKENSKYKKLDRTVLLSIIASRLALKNSKWIEKEEIAVNIGSSRGATELFEKYHFDFIKNDKTAVLTSPTTTLGNISSSVANDLFAKGFNLSHSVTCSTALHSIINGIAWLKSGLANKVIAGGSEAATTNFTIAQMKALKIYSKSNDSYPCKALDLDKNENTMILGEGAASFCLENGISENKIATIEGFGFGSEFCEHSAFISDDGENIEKAMQMAIGNNSPEDIDIIITHSPGTVKGDLAEFEAIKNIFPDKLPALTNNKWKIGHTLGASGALNLEMSILMLNNQEFLSTPFIKSEKPKKINKILVNSIGFGGNAASILISK